MCLVTIFCAVAQQYFASHNLSSYSQTFFVVATKQVLCSTRRQSRELVMHDYIYVVRIVVVCCAQTACMPARNLFSATMHVDRL